MPVLYINTSAIREHANRLERMGKSLLPVVVRQTLNAAAYDVKTETMPEEAARFIHRKPTFFKANSGVTQAQGMEVNSMAAIVGFKPKANDRSHSVEDLEQQEEGGVIPHSRAFITLKQGRISQQWQKNPMTRNYEQAIGTAIDSKKSLGKSGKQQFVRAAFEGAAKNKLVIGNFTNGNGNKIAWRINAIIPMEGDQVHIDATPVFAVKKDRKVDIKETHFMRKAALDTQKKMEAMFIKNANAQFSRFL